MGDYDAEGTPAMDAVLAKEDSFSNFLKDNITATSTENRPKGARKIKKVANKDEGLTTEAADENLGENFEETPWLPPSIEKAIEFRKKSIYHGGEIRIESLELVSAPDLGAGTTLYFQFAMTMSLCLCVMSVLSLPALVFIYNGTGIKQEDQDAFGLYKYTLGNMGAQDYGLAGSRCTSGAYAYNETCIHYGDSEITVTEAANVMTAMEFIQIFVFLFGVLYLQQKVYSVSGRAAKTQTSISDYTVEVHNIPPDTKDWQILQHFSDLYGLDKPDYKYRPAVEGAHPVVDCDNTDNAMHCGTWVAECTLHKGIGPFIASFKDKQYLMEKLYRCRAKMKMYAENSPHEGGHKLNHYLAAEQEMIATGTLIDRLTENTIKKKKLKIIAKTDDENDARPGTAGGKGAGGHKVNSTQQISNPNSIYRNIDAPAVSAYITFQYAESRARCLEDYEKYASLPYSLFYPQKLMFRGYKLRVTPAPEPDQIVWENLEVNVGKRYYMRARTAVIAVLLVILSFIVILQAAIYKNIFSGRIPSLEVCDTVVPTLYANGTDVDISTMVLTRPPSESRISYDTTCSSTMGSDTFYAVYTTDGNFDNPFGHYDISACGVHGYCPKVGYASFCPCISIKSKEPCLPAGCTGSDEEGKECDTFKASNIGVCFCYSALNEGLSADGVVATLNKLDSSNGDTSCKSFYKDYSLSVGLTYASVATTAVANTALRTFLKVLSKQEAHTSSDEEEGSIMIKMFQSSYVMMAIIVLIAYGTSDGTPQFLRDVRIFVGPYNDFTRAWYGNIGFYLMTTFIVQSFSPLMYNLFDHFVGKPLMRYYHHDRVRKLQSTRVVMQHDLNMLEVGPVFDATMHTAQLLTLLFFAMTFAPGLPLLMPLCCFAFILYFRIDKFLLCRFYQKPPQFGDAAIKVVIAQLPWACVIRLAFGCWMLGNNSILPEDSAGALSSGTDAAESQTSGGVAGHIARSNTLPLLVLMIIIVAAKLVMKVFEYLPIYWVLKCLFIVFRELESSHHAARVRRATQDGDEAPVHPWNLVKSGDPNRQQIAPFTGDYLRFIKHKDEIPDTCMQMCSYAYLTNIGEAELEEGWEMRHQGDFVIKVKVWKEVKRKSKHKRGDLKKTYEVIADHRCATYNIEKIPAYVIPMQGLREGTMSMMEYQLRDQQDKNVVDAMLYEAFDSGNLESNVIANYKKRKTGMPGDIEALTSKAVARRAKQAALDEEDEDEYEEEDQAVNDKPIKPKPTIQTKHSRGVAIENPSDSFYLTDASTPTPHGPPTTQRSYGLGASSGGTPHATAGTTVGNISMVTKGKEKYGAPPPPSVPAYLAVAPDDELENAPKEVHVAYFPKSRSAGQSSDEGDGGHKAYFPPSRSGDSHEERHKKKKDKKNKHKKDSREIELPAVSAHSSHHAPKSSHSAHSSAPSAYSYEGYEEDPYGDDYGGYAGGEGGDYDDGGGVGGLV